MQNRAKVAGLFLALAVLLALAAHAGPYAIDLHAVASGGNVASGRYALTGTASQSDASRAVQSGRYILSSGFWSQFDPGAVPPALLGPVYPPPLGVTFSSTGVNISRSGGVTWLFTNTALASSTPVYWGVTNGGVQLSLDGLSPSGSEIMKFDPHQSSLAGGSLVFTGSTTLFGYYFSFPLLHTRCRVLVNQPLIDPINVGLPANLGGVLRVTSPNFTWQAQMFMEVSPDGNSGWQPALDLYDSAGAYGGGTAFSSFAAGFYYINRLPLVSPIPDLIIPPGTQSAPIPFTVSDPQYPVAALAIATNSDNTLILPNNAIQVSGSGGNYNMTLTTAFNFLGVAHVTITATDPVGGFGQSVFTVYSDTPPTISPIGAQSTPINTVIGPIGFTVGDNETAAGSLTLSARSSNQLLVPVANIVYGGSGVNRTVTVTPTTGQTGTGQISTVVSDGILTATNTFSLTVTSPPLLSGASFNGSGQLRLQFTAAAGSTNTVLATTNLNIHTALWTPIGTATETSPGNFQFTDTSASSYKRRFYRILSP